MALPEKIEAIVGEVLERHACELVHATLRVERGGLVLRLLVEKSGSDPDSGSGVDHRLLSSVSRDLGARLEVEEAIERAYTLEVSSPGVERPLTKDQDFVRFAGRPARVKTREPIDGRRAFQGVLEGIEGTEVIVSCEKNRYRIPRGLIKKANLVFDPKRSNRQSGR